MVDSKAGRGVLIRYSRDGATGTGPETVVQYSIAVGLELFRLNGVMPDKQVAKYEPIIDVHDPVVQGAGGRVHLETLTCWASVVRLRSTSPRRAFSQRT